MTFNPLRIITSRRGSILVHVLVTSILVTVIAAGLMTFLMMQYKMADLSAKASQNKKKDEQVLAELIANWNIPGVEQCTNFGSFTCTPGGITVCTAACKAPESCTWTSGCYCRVGSVGPIVCVTDEDAVTKIRKIKIVSSPP